MNKYILPLLTIVTLVFNPVMVIAKTDINAENDRYIVKFNKGAKNSVVKAIKNNRGQVKRAIDKHRLLAVQLPAHVANQFKKRADVEFIEQDPKRYLLNESQPYGISMVEANLLSDTYTGEMTVCIMDTGYDRGHEDLPTLGVTGDDGYGDYDSGNWYQDGHGHGTHVSGTIAALSGNGIGVIGVNPNGLLKLHMVKVFNQQGAWAYGSDLVAAVYQCIDAGAKVISMSLGGGGSSVAEQAAFDDAYDNYDVLSIAAAGNDGNSGFSYPASYDSVISVAAVDSSANRASFSQYNSQVEIAAPGVGVLSTLPNNSYDSWSGTSMATPHVAGVAALVWSHYLECTNQQMRGAIAHSAQDQGSDGRDNYYGYGVVKAQAMFNLLIDGCDVGELPAPPGPMSLENGVAVNSLSGTSGDELQYKIELPAGATDLIFAMSGGSGDADLYVKFAAQPSITGYECRPYSAGNNETCSFNSPQIGTYYVMIRGYSNFNSVALVANFSLTIANQPPVSLFTYQCSDLSCDFDATASSDSDGSITSYLWDFGSGNSANGQMSSFTFSDDGNYPVSLTVYDDAADSDFSSQIVNVVDLTPNIIPVALFSALCTDLNCTFDARDSYDSDGSIDIYSWQFEGSSTDKFGVELTHGFASPDTYKVTLTVTDNDAATHKLEKDVEVTVEQIGYVISLEASIRATRKNKHAVDLVWADAEGSKVEIHRTGAAGNKAFRTRNDGRHSDTVNGTGSSYYKVCQLAGSVCSAEVMVLIE